MGIGPVLPMFCAASSARQTNDLPTTHTHQKLTESFSRGSSPVRTHPTRPDPGAVVAAEVTPTAVYLWARYAPPRSEMHAAQYHGYAHFGEFAFHVVGRIGAS